MNEVLCFPDNNNNNNNNNSNNIIFTMKGTKMYVPVSNLSGRYNQKLPILHSKEF